MRRALVTFTATTAILAGCGTNPEASNHQEADPNITAAIPGCSVRTTDGQDINAATIPDIYELQTAITNTDTLTTAQGYIYIDQGSTGNAPTVGIERSKIGISNRRRASIALGALTITITERCLTGHGQNRPLKDRKFTEYLLFRLPKVGRDVALTDLPTLTSASPSSGATR